MDNSLLTLESLGGVDWYNQWLFNKFSNYLKGDILEVGCGIGTFAPFLALKGKVVSIDINRKYLKVAKKTRKSLVGYGDIEKGRYFFKSKKFDSIVCINVLEHIESEMEALLNMYRLLKPGGNLILVVPSHKSLYGEIDKAIFHYRRYGKKDLRVLLKEARLKTVYLKRLNLLGGLGWFIAGRILRDRSVSKKRLRIFNLIGPAFLFFERFIEAPLGTSILVIAKK